MLSGISLKEKLKSYEAAGQISSESKARMFVSLEHPMCQSNYIERGVIIEEMWRSFFSLWSEKCGTVVPVPQL